MGGGVQEESGAPVSSWVIDWSGKKTRKEREKHE